MSSIKISPKIIKIDEQLTCCDKEWEAAYLRFETPEEEIRKFIERLKTLGADQLNKDIKAVEIFCGRGNGLLALQGLGFKNLEGLDLSERLLMQCNVESTLYICDCRKLPFEDNSRDLIIVQGGLHHLPHLPEDLILTISEVYRVLKPGGRFLLVEPWSTPFLKFVHRLTSFSFVRKLYRRLEDLAIMIDRERVTYENWLSRAAEINCILTERFDPVMDKNRFGKKLFHGIKKSDLR